MFPHLYSLGPRSRLVDLTLLERLDCALASGNYHDPEGTTGSLRRFGVGIQHRRKSCSSPATKAWERTAFRGNSLSCSAVRQVRGNLEGRPLYAPVKTIGEPVSRETSPSLVTFSIDAWGQKGDVKLSYLFGEVVVDSPPWLKPSFRPPPSAKANAIDASSPAARR